MNHAAIADAIAQTPMPAIVKKVQWRLGFDLDGDPIIQITLRVPQADDPTDHEVAQIVAAQRAIELALSSREIHALSHFHVVANAR